MVQIRELPPPRTILDDLVLAINLLSIEFAMEHFTLFQQLIFFNIEKSLQSIDIAKYNPLR